MSNSNQPSCSIYTKVILPIDMYDDETPLQIKKSRCLLTQQSVSVGLLLQFLRVCYDISVSLRVQMLLLHPTTSKCHSIVVSHRSPRLTNVQYQGEDCTYT